jgi:class 3 adenylate cyclase
VAGPTPEELEAAGLYDPADPLAPDRLQLIEYLVGLGYSIDEMVAAGDELNALSSQRALWGNAEWFTLADAATRAGVPEEVCARIWRAAGFVDPAPDARVCNDEDVETFIAFQAGAALLGEDVVLQVLSVIGSSLARIADATVSAFIVNVGAAKLADDPGGLSLAMANTEAVGLLRQASPAMDVIFRHHVDAMQRPITMGDQRTQELSIGFVDLVGSTGFAQRRAIADLGAALGEFDEIVSDVVIAGGGRVVKLIGDEVMFVTPDPTRACEIARTLAARFDEHPVLPPVRAGVGCGAVLSRDGDFFGPVVNAAARIVKLADPGRVVVTRDVRDRVGPDRFTSVGTCELKGFDEPLDVFELRERADPAR